MSALLSFRLRGREVTRLEAFSDAVFGFAATLLVVSLEVPRSYDEVMASLRGFIPFAMCFAILIWIWSAHNGFFRRYGMQDAGTTALNAILLFVVLFFMYPLRFVLTSFSEFVMARMGIIPWSAVSVDIGTEAARMTNLSTMFALYSIGFAATFACLALLYRRALAYADVLELDEGERFDARSHMGEFTLFVGIGVVATAISLTGIGARVALGGWIYGAIGPVAVLWTRHRLRMRERLVGTGAPAAA